MISKIGTFHTKTLAEITQVNSFKEEPPHTLTFKQMANAAKEIAMALHVHAQEWISCFSKVSCKILATKTKTKPSHEYS